MGNPVQENGKFSETVYLIVSIYLEAVVKIYANKMVNIEICILDDALWNLLQSALHPSVSHSITSNKNPAIFRPGTSSSSSSIESSPFYEIIEFTADKKIEHQ